MAMAVALTRGMVTAGEILPLPVFPYRRVRMQGAVGLVYKRTLNCIFLDFIDGFSLAKSKIWLVGFIKSQNK
jgi:hypothetical protein